MYILFELNMLCHSNIHEYHSICVQYCIILHELLKTRINIFKANWDESFHYVFSLLKTELCLLPFMGHEREED